MTTKPGQEGCQIFVGIMIHLLYSLQAFRLATIFTQFSIIQIPEKMQASQEIYPTLKTSVHSLCHFVRR